VESTPSWSSDSKIFLLPDETQRAWIVKGSKCVRAILNNHPKISASRKPIEDVVHKEMEDCPQLQLLVDWLLFQDNEEHKNKKQVLLGYLTMSRVKSMREYIEQMTDRLLDEFGSSGTIEFMQKFAQPLPCLVVGRMIGMPEEDIPKVKTFSDAINLVFGQSLGMEGHHKRIQDFKPYAREFYGYIQGLIKKYKEFPDDSLISLMINEEQKVFKNEGELASNITMLLFAAQETTTNLLGNLMYLLLTNRDQMELLKSNPSLISGAIEETMRRRPPVKSVMRCAMEDFEMDGHEFQKEDVIVVDLYNSTNENYDNRDKFDIKRKVVGHFGFGGGSHICPGRNLARLEAEISILKIIQRFPNMELVSHKWGRLAGLYSLESMLVKL